MTTRPPTTPTSPYPSMATEGFHDILLIAGSREIIAHEPVNAAMEEALKRWTILPTTFLFHIHGGQRGADHQGHMWALRHTLASIRFSPPQEYPSPGRYLARNEAMAMIATHAVLLYLWTPDVQDVQDLLHRRDANRGTNDMRKRLLKHRERNWTYSPTPVMFAVDQTNSRLREIEWEEQ